MIRRVLKEQKQTRKRQHSHLATATWMDQRMDQRIETGRVGEREFVPSGGYDAPRLGWGVRIKEYLQILSSFKKGALKRLDRPKLAQCFGLTFVDQDFVDQDQDTGKKQERHITACRVPRSAEGLGCKMYAGGRMLGVSKIAGECVVLSPMGGNDRVPNWHIGIARGQIIESFHVEKNYVDKKAGLFNGLV